MTNDHYEPPVKDLTRRPASELQQYFDKELHNLTPHNDSTQTGDTTIYSHRFSPPQLRRRFATINHVFSDADGTILPEGLHAIPKEYVQLLHDLADATIHTTIVTGKPLAEVQPIFAAVGSDAPFEIMCEKGAYIARQDSQGTVQIDYLLSSAMLEKEVTRMRAAWEEYTSAKASGSAPYYFGWSGSGQHRSIISIDIFSKRPPRDYLSMTGHTRDMLKLKNNELLKMAESEIEVFFKKLQPAWRIVHLGNANTDITPHLIEKDIALEASASFQQASGVLVLGDSNNDRAMFSLTKRHDKVTAGQILYRAGGLELTRASDAVTIGMANCMPYLRLLLEMHSV